MTSSNSNSAHKWIDHIDHFLLPVAGALVCVLCAAQAATLLPGVRQAVDRVEGRFVSQQVAAPAATEHAQLTFYLSGQGSSTVPLVAVESGGQLLGTLSNKPLTIQVSEGQQILFKRLQDGPNNLVVSVEHNSPTLLQPISGWSATLTGRRTIVALPPVQFAQ